MVIYIDVLIILNYFINFLIILGASALAGRSVSKTRLFLSSLFGGLYSLVLLLPDMGKTVSVLIKISGLIIMTFIAFGRISFKPFLRALGSMCLISFSFAGAFFVVYLVFKPDKMAMGNGAVYFDIGVRFFLLCSVVCYLFIKLILFLVKRNAADNVICTLTIEYNSKSAVLKGLIDTGNSLTDVFTGKPVTTVEKVLLRRILPDNLPEERKSVIPVKTAVGNGIMPVVRFDRMIIEHENKRYEILSPLIALSDSDLSGGEYQALINSRIFEYGRNKNETSENNKQNILKTSVALKKGTDSLHRQRSNSSRTADGTAGERGVRSADKR
jgi:stage II sporulation protein GA (sporulation sigma-E factor processing peptidase)